MWIPAPPQFGSTHQWAQCCRRPAAPHAAACTRTAAPRLHCIDVLSNKVCWIHDFWEGVSLKETAFIIRRKLNAEAAVHVTFMPIHTHGSKATDSGQFVEVSAQLSACIRPILIASPGAVPPWHLHRTWHAVLLVSHGMLLLRNATVRLSMHAGA